MPESSIRGTLWLVSYALSFSSDFFRGSHPGGPENLHLSDRPTSVEQALRSLTSETWARLARDVFGCDPNYIDVETVLATVIETNTCSNLDPPVEVWIDRAGEFRVRVFEQ